MTIPSLDRAREREQLLDLLRGYRAAQVLISGAELGVFEALAQGPRTARSVAEAVQADRRGLELWLNAAVALGLLEKNGEHYANAPLAAACLVKDGAHYLGHFIRREAAFYRRWSYLTSAVKTGQRPEENSRDEEPKNWVWEFEYALYNLSRVYGPPIAAALNLPTDRPLRVLDVGGGHGGYSLALARRYPQLTAVVLDLPRVVPVAEEIIAAEGLGERVSARAGDFRTDPLGGGFDLALLFGVLNGEPPEGRAKLIDRVFYALKPGGRVVVREFALNPDRTSPSEAAVFALQMLLSTDKGGLSTTDEIAQWLARAGFNQPETVPLDGRTSSPLIIAEKAM